MQADSSVLFTWLSCMRCSQGAICHDMDFQIYMRGWHMQAGGDLPEAFAVLGFAFYVQPMLMPLLHELPPGPASVSLTATAVRIVVIGVASLVRPCPFLHSPFHAPCMACEEGRCAYAPSWVISILTPDTGTGVLSFQEAVVQDCHLSAISW